MEKIVLPLSLYDVLLEAIKFDSPAEVLHRVTYHLNLPKDSKKATRALSYLLSAIVRLEKDDLLELLSETLLEHNIPVDAEAVKEATTFPLQRATFYLDKLFALGWDINKALSNTEPPVLSIAFHDMSLTLWLLQRGANPNATCDIDYTPLSVAVGRASISVVQLLLQYARHGHNGYLVHYASQREDTNEAVRVIRLLHQHQKPVDEILFQDPLSYRLRAPFLRGTPLYYACEDGKLLVALTLLVLGADPDKACVRYNQIVGPSPRAVALRYGWPFLGRDR